MQLVAGSWANNFSAAESAADLKSHIFSKM